MSLNRRKFIKLCAGTVAGFGISQMFHPDIVDILKAANSPDKPHIIWLQGSGCTGCSISILNASNPGIAKVLLEIVNMDFQPTLMCSEGEVAWENLLETTKKFPNKFYIIVEGAVSVAEDGLYCIVGEHQGRHITLMEALKVFAPLATTVMAVGACACVGGVPGAKGGRTQAMPVYRYLDMLGIKTPVVNVPGCPPHPDWMIGTLVHLLGEGMPELDSQRRPKMFYGRNIHDNCPYLKYYETGKRQPDFTKDKTDACRAGLGCKGPLAYADCFERHWNSHTNWCIGNALCIGCVEDNWPDAFSPFYRALV